MNSIIDHQKETVNELPKNGQTKVELFAVDQRFSCANNGSTFPQFCLDGAEHEWIAKIRPEMYRSGYHEDHCLVCHWKHSWDDSD